LKISLVSPTRFYVELAIFDALLNNSQ